MNTGELIELRRDCKAIEIPSGIERVLPAGSFVRISRQLGSVYTVISDIGCSCVIDRTDADALGLTPALNAEKNVGPFREQMVWDELKSVYDPEIPGKKIEVNMSMTAPGCGMANVLKAEVEQRLRRLPEVKEVSVQVVFDPPWHPGRMSEAARLQLGLDLEQPRDPFVRVSR